MFRYFLILLINFAVCISFFSIDSNAAKRSDCLVRTYVFDVGSSSTKSAAYLIDKCKNEILEKQNLVKHFSYQYCISNSLDNNTLSKECMDDGIAILLDLQNYYKVDCFNSNCIGIATAWARNASNISEWLSKVRLIGIELKVLPQAEEGKLGFDTLKFYADRSKLNLRDFIVWDVGGGSFQLTWLPQVKEVGNHHESGDLSSIKLPLLQYNSSLGSDNFAKLLLDNFASHIKHDTVKEFVFFKSTQMQQIEKFARSIFAKGIENDNALQNKIKQPNLNLISGSMLMRLGIKEQFGLDKDIVTREEIKKLAYSLCDKSIDEVRVIYPNLKEELLFSYQSSLIILYVNMEILGIEKLYIANIDLLDYLALKDLRSQSYRN